MSAIKDMVGKECGVARWLMKSTRMFVTSDRERMAAREGLVERMRERYRKNVGTPYIKSEPELDSW